MSAATSDPAATGGSTGSSFRIAVIVSAAVSR